MNDLDKKLIERMKNSISVNGNKDSKKKEDFFVKQDVKSSFLYKALNYDDYIEDDDCYSIPDKVTKELVSCDDNCLKEEDIVLSIFSEKEYFDCFDAEKISSARITYETKRTDDTIWADMSTCYVNFTYHPDAKDDGLGFLSRLMRGERVNVNIGNAHKNGCSFPIGEFTLYSFKSDEVNGKLLYRITLYHNIQND